MPAHHPFWFRVFSKAFVSCLLCPLLLLASPSAFATFFDVMEGIGGKPDYAKNTRKPLYTKTNYPIIPDWVDINFRALAEISDRGGLDLGFMDTITVELIDISSVSQFTSLAQSCKGAGLPMWSAHDENPTSTETGFNGKIFIPSKAGSRVGYVRVPLNIVSKRMQYKITYNSNVYCSTDTFALRPAYFSLESKPTSATDNKTCGKGDPASGNDTNAVSVYGSNTTSDCYAGVPFNVQLKVPGIPNPSAYSPSPVYTLPLKAEWTERKNGVLQPKELEPGVLAVIGKLTQKSAFGSFSAQTATASFVYDEVGYFKFIDNQIKDKTWLNAANDAAGDVANGDCIPNDASWNHFANSPDYKIGCEIGSRSDYFGRFMPHHFKLTIDEYFDATVWPAAASGKPKDAEAMLSTYAGAPYPFTLSPQRYCDDADPLCHGNRTSHDTYLVNNYKGGYAKSLAVSRPCMGIDGSTVPCVTGGLTGLTQNGMNFSTISDLDMAKGPFKGEVTSYLPAFNEPMTGEDGPCLSGNLNNIKAEDCIPNTRGQNIGRAKFIVADSDNVRSASTDDFSLSWSSRLDPYYGRVHIKDAIGPSDKDLKISFAVEHWYGFQNAGDADRVPSGWIAAAPGEITFPSQNTRYRKTIDERTGNEAIFGTKNQIALNQIALALSKSPAGLKTCVRDNGAPGASGAGCSDTPSGVLPFIKGGMAGFTGDFHLSLKAPKEPGSVQIKVTLPTWLLCAVNGVLVTAEKCIATARFTGARKRKSPYTWYREVY